MEKNFAAYKRAVGTMTKIQQVVMLYDGVITNLLQVKQHIRDKDFQETYNKIEKSYLILSGLRDCIDSSFGEEVSKTLISWYTDTCSRIMHINRGQDLEMCDLCIDTIKEMRDVWSELSKQVDDNGELIADSKSNIADGESVSLSNDENGDAEEIPSVPAGNANMYSKSLLEGLSLSV